MMHQKATGTSFKEKFSKKLFYNRLLNGAETNATSETSTFPRR
jgi:hypothetical protein